MGNELSEEQLKYFASFVEKELGIIFNETNYYQLHQRLEKVAQYLGVALLELVSRAQSDGISGDFRQFLLDTATNNETSFFRDPKLWPNVVDTVLKEFIANRPGATSYRIWSAAASYGQEPFSIAMLVKEFLTTHPSHPHISIDATDVAEHALKRCREATYSQLEVQRGLPTPKLLAYFDKSGDASWTVKSSIQALVQFKKQNLLDPFSNMGKFDLIFCRYVLVYQDAKRKKEILDRLIKCLHPRGYLVLGATETIFGLTQDLEQVNCDGAVIYRNKS